MDTRIEISAAVKPLKNPWLTLARLIWLVIVMFMVSDTLAGFPEYFRRMLALTAWMNLNAPWDIQTLSAALGGLGLSSHSLALIALSESAVQLLVYTAVGGLIFWRKSDTWLGLFTSFVLIGMGTTVGSSLLTLENLASPWQELVTFTNGLVWPALFIFLFIFPDGRFIPRWTRLFVYLWALFYFWYTLSDLVLKLGIDTFKYFGSFFILISIAVSLYSQVYRYLRISGPVQRQQTKWFLFAISIILVGVTIQNLFLVPFLAATTLPSSQVLLIDLVNNLFAYSLGIIFLPLSIGIALFRYRLWDVDILIRRTLVYSTLTGALLALYLAVVIILQELFQLVTGQHQSSIATVISTLAIAALFNTLRKGIQKGIDRRFYRRRYNAEQTLQTFANTLRDEVDLDQLRSHIISVVLETMQPEHVSVWIKPAQKARITDGA